MFHCRSVLRVSTLRQHFSAVPVTAGLVKELREKSGAPMMECKKALSDPTVEGDIPKAMDWLRAKGIARASSQADKVTAAGVIAVYSNSNKRTLVEINSETDFVCRNAQFHEFVRSVCTTAQLAPAGVVNISTLLGTHIPLSVAQKDRPLNDRLIDIISTIRENVVIKRVENFEDVDVTSAVYVHGKVADDVAVDASNEKSLMQIGSAAALVSCAAEGVASSQEDGDVLATIGRKLAMHVVAASPLFLQPSDAPADVVAKETDIAREQIAAETEAAIASGKAKTAKPQSVVDKIILGKVNKRIGEMSLLGQNHVVEAGSPVIDKFLKSVQLPSASTPLVVTRFARWAVGEEEST